jgi:hypothetical protein
MISLQELTIAKRKLEKYSKEKREENKIAAILNALADYTVNTDHLIDSGIAPVIREIKKTFANSDAGKEARIVLGKWKRELVAGSGEDNSAEDASSFFTDPSTSTLEEENDEQPVKKMKITPLERIVSDGDSGAWNEKIFELLSETRRKVRPEIVVT